MKHSGKQEIYSEHQITVAEAKGWKLRQVGHERRRYGKANVIKTLDRLSEGYDQGKVTDERDENRQKWRQRVGIYNVGYKWPLE